MSTHELQALLDDIRHDLRDHPERGRIATYIPELAKVDPNKFAIAIATVDGEVISTGDASEPFSIQSISKVFTLTLALDRWGDALWQRVGREPSGNPFNSIVQLEHDRGIPRNPFINAGALVVTNHLLADHEPQEVIAEILGFLRSVSGDPSVFIDVAVAASERETGFRNAALANYIRSFGNLEHAVGRTLEVYFHHCAIAMSCRQLACAGRFLANAGRQVGGDAVVISPERARRINAIMMTCGHYDGSGDFAFRVGLPAKSGVAGGILAIVPGEAAIAVWSPGLNQIGNSLLGSLALERLARERSWNVFNS